MHRAFLIRPGAFVLRPFSRLRDLQEGPRFEENREEVLCARQAAKRIVGHMLLMTWAICPTFLWIKIVCFPAVLLNHFKYNNLYWHANSRLRGTKLAEVSAIERHAAMPANMTTSVTRRQETKMRLSFKQIASTGMTSEKSAVADGIQHSRHSMRRAVVITMMLSLCVIGHDVKAAIIGWM